eukprot:CAMPEP_0113554392 /NCGR_PEP_ID=MMETSP0015_2-20120614/16124_1 /TAXON_ID=2838 /ORGANISM="Odontella" /LENGTH=100 /DNA_ID=CAMNT_0000455529 /DNA_START=509 /DNA_END=811 /DNA_ORIENTATION=+ /assembly_acc=CAM_ASM_000160
MRDVSENGTLGEILSVLVVCEWSYLSWGSRVLGKTKRTRFECFEWVDLHSGDTFEGVVQYLRGLLDKEGDLLDEEGRRACERRFVDAVSLEEAFFGSAYD